MKNKTNPKHKCHVIIQTHQVGSAIARRGRCSSHTLAIRALVIP